MTTTFEQADRKRKSLLERYYVQGFSTEGCMRRTCEALTDEELGALLEPLADEIIKEFDSARATMG